jgi:hypothetical protein
MKCKKFCVAQSQGDFSMKKSKMHVPSCSWYFIKNEMAAEGINSFSTVKFSQPRVFLSWGLTYHSHRHTGCLDVLRFDTSNKLDVFRRLFGQMAGYGVRKKRPRYSDGPVLLSLNDVLNVVVCPSAEGDETDNNVFHRFGVTEDGIDMEYNSSEGTLQISLRYRKMVVTNESLSLLAGVGVCDPRARIQVSNETLRDILPGMEFMDGIYVMRIHEVQGSVIHAKKVYKIVDSDGRTAKVNALEVVIYRDIQAVHRKIQEMLD